MSSPTMMPDSRFDQAAQLVLGYLKEHVPLAFWAVTRVENGRQTYLYLDADNGYGLPRGGSHPWEDSFCVHMAAGHAPAVAPDAQAVPQYAAAGVNRSVQIGAYAGTPIAEPDGSLFGAICGLDPQVRTDDPRMVAAGPLLQLLGRLLTTVLAADRFQDTATAAMRAARLDADTDPLTGLPNRRAWEDAIAHAQAQFERFADPTVAAMLDLDLLKIVNDTQGHAAGDAYIAAAAEALRRAAGGHGVIARLGGDEFGILLAHCTEAAAGEKIDRIYAELAAEGVAGSVGWAPITVLRGFPAALADADAAMYAAKRQRRSATPSVTR